MTQRDASSLDLNMLRLFVVLYQEKNMRQAAFRLHVSQPAISHSLKKLREHFDDQLFVKVPQGLEPTPLAHQIASISIPYLEGLTQELNNLTEFDPTLLEQTVRIAIATPILPSITGNLLKSIKEQAPLIKLEIVTWTHQSLNDLGEDKVLLGVNYGDIPHTKQIISKPFVDIRPTVIHRKEHPLASKNLELNDLIGYELASLIIPGWNDKSAHAIEVLKKYNVNVKIGLRSEVLLALIDTISQTDMFIAHNELFPIQHFPHLTMRSAQSLISPEDYQLKVNSYCHIKNRHSKLVKWLCALIKESLQHQVDISMRYCDPH